MLFQRTLLHDVVSRTQLQVRNHSKGIFTCLLPFQRHYYIPVSVLRVLSDDCCGSKGIIPQLLSFQGHYYTIGTVRAVCVSGSLGRVVLRHIECRPISRARGAVVRPLLGEPIWWLAAKWTMYINDICYCCSRLLWIYVFLTTLYLAVRYHSRCCQFSDCLIHIISLNTPVC